MVFEYDLSSVVCPKCYTNNEDIGVIGMHIFPYSEGDRLPYYHLICYNCLEVFTKQVSLSIKEV